MSGSRNSSKDIVFTLYQDNRTVFRLVDVAMLVGETDMLSLGKKLNYHVRKGKLLNPRKGIYTKPEFSSEELACRIYSPSYISLDYVLQKSGIIFQYDTQVTAVSYLSRTIEVANQSYRFRRLKEPILVNMSGVWRQPDHINIASPERAFLDMLYLEPDFYFDNSGSLDKKLIRILLPVYNSKALNKRVVNHF